MSIKLDLKQFKYKDSDEKCTTLQHKDGHTITLSHKHLSKEGQAQLEALRNAKPEDKESKKESDKQKPVKMAEGGLLDRAGAYLDDLADKAADQGKYKKTPMRGERKPAAEPLLTSGYAEGGKVEDALKFDAEKPVEPPSRESEYQKRYSELRQTFPNQPDEVINRTVLRDMGQEVEVQQARSAEAQARQAEQAQKAQEQTASQQQQSVLNDGARIKAGLQPLTPPAAAQPQQPAPATTGIAPQQPAQVPTPAVPGMQSGEDISRQGLSQTIAGIQQEAGALKQQAEAENAAYVEFQAKQKQIVDDYNKQKMDLDTERNHFIQDIKDGYIDPNKYWTGYTAPNGQKIPGHSKVAAVIGMLVAGFGGNDAVKMLNDQIEQSINAQKDNLHSSHNLLNANLAQYKNLQDATSMTRIMMNDSLTMQLQQAAAKAKSPMAQAAALKAIGELKLKNAQELEKLSQARTLEKLKQTMSLDPNNAEKYLTALEAVAPEQAKGLRERLVPGVGFALTNEGAKGVREMKTTVDSVMSDVGRLKQILSKTGKSLSPNLRAEADSIRNTLIGRLRVPIVGPGAMSDTERDIIESLIPDVTSMTSLDSRTMTKLKSIEQRMGTNYDAMLKANGLKPQSPAATEPVERFDKTTGKVALFDPQTKKFLGYKQ